MTNTAELRIQVTAEGGKAVDVIDGVNVELKKTEEATKKAGLGMASLASFLGNTAAKAFAATVRGVVDLTKASAVMAVNLSRTGIAADDLNGQLDAIYGTSAKLADSFRNGLAGGINRSRAEIGGMMREFGTFAAGIGIDGSQRAQFGGAFAALAQDLDAEFGTDANENAGKLIAAINGSARALVQYGVRIEETDVRQRALERGVIRVGQELSVEAAAALRAEIILERFAFVSGKAARESGDFENNLKGVQAIISDTADTLGSRLNAKLLDLLNHLGGAGKVREVVQALSSAAVAIGQAAYYSIRDTIAQTDAIMKHFTEGRTFIDGVSRLLTATGDAIELWAAKQGARVSKAIWGFIYPSGQAGEMQAAADTTVALLENALKITFDQRAGNLAAQWQEFQADIFKVDAAGARPPDQLVLDLGKALKDTGATAEQFAVSGIQRTADALTQMAMGAVSAKEGLRSLFASVAADLIRYNFTNLLTGLGFGNIFSSVFNAGTVKPFAMGGVQPGGFGNAMPLKPYAGGGPIMRSPHVAVIGEGNYDEAVVPLPDGRSIPVSMKGGGGGGGSLNLTVNAIDSQSFAAALARSPDAAGVIMQWLVQRRGFRAAFGGAAI